MAKTIEVPDFKVSGIYYPQLLDMLMEFKRANVPELTDESEFEPLIQMVRAFALTGHLSNVLLDLLGNESTLATAKLPESIRNMLKLIGERLEPASPSEVDIVLELSEVLTTDTEIAPAGAQVATQRSGDTPAVVFEIPDAVTIPRTDQVSFVFVEDSAGVFTDRTAETLASSGFPAFADDIAPGTKLYVGLVDAMWDKLGITFDSDTVAGVDGVWEFFDGNLDLGNPDSVEDLGVNLRFTLNGLLGDENRAGAIVRVRLTEGTAYEDCVSQWDGTDNFIETVGALGQTVVSTSVEDYSVGSEWRELSVSEDTTTQFTTSGDITFDLPQDLEQNWSQTDVNAETAFWLRFRIVDVPAAVQPTVTTITVDGQKQYAIVVAVQGRSQVETLGSSDGTTSQRFEASKSGYIDETMEVTVDGETWTAVDNFLQSSPSDKHYLVELGDDDAAVVVFGDGVAGAIPPVGANNVIGSYRFGVEDDGNVGANTIIVDRSGLSFVNRIFNPRAATGWTEGEAATPEGLERAKIRAPASLRIKEVAVGPDDVETLALDFQDSNNAKPFSRALAIEEGFGPKTIELVLVGAGGGQPTSDQLTESDEYFNGVKFSTPRSKKHVVANQRVYSRAFTPRVVDVTAVVDFDGDPEEIVNALTLLLQPEALRTDGITYEWDFGGEVPTTRLNAEIFEAIPGKVRKVVSLTAPSADVTLGTRELPVAGTITIVKAS